MSLTEDEVRQAERRMRALLKRQPRAMTARYDRRGERIVVGLSNGLELGVPVSLTQGLAGANSSDLSKIEISPTGFGLQWPRLDADLYLPGLLEGISGSRRWLVKVMGRAGGRETLSAHMAVGRA